MTLNIWKQKTGKLILIERMTDNHLMNTIAMLERDNKQIYFDGWDIEQNKEYDALIEESTRRKLIKLGE